MPCTGGLQIAFGIRESACKQQGCFQQHIQAVSDLLSHQVYTFGRLCKLSATLQGTFLLFGDLQALLIELLPEDLELKPCTALSTQVPAEGLVTLKACSKNTFPEVADGRYRVRVVQGGVS